MSQYLKVIQQQLLKHLKYPDNFYKKNYYVKSVFFSNTLDFWLKP